MKTHNRRRPMGRIDPLIDLLREYWKSHPDLRLGQIVCNLSGNDDPFYTEDDVILERLKREGKHHEQLLGHSSKNK